MNRVNWSTRVGIRIAVVTASVLRSPDHLAAAKHMNDYCGVTATLSH